MTAEIPKTTTPETRILENAMSGKIHDIPSPGPCWVDVESDLTAPMWLDLHDATDQLTFINCFKRGLTANVGPIDLPSNPNQCHKCYRGEYRTGKWTAVGVYINTKKLTKVLCPSCKEGGAK